MIEILCTCHPSVSPTKRQRSVSQTFTSPQMNNICVVSYVRYKDYLQLVVAPVPILILYTHVLFEEALILRFSHTATYSSVTPYLFHSSNITVDEPTLDDHRTSTTDYRKMSETKCERGLWCWRTADGGRWCQETCGSCTLPVKFRVCSCLGTSEISNHDLLCLTKTILLLVQPLSLWKMPCQTRRKQRLRWWQRAMLRRYRESKVLNLRLVDQGGLQNLTRMSMSGFENWQQL